MRVYTIGFGTIAGPSPDQSPFGFGGGGGGGFGGGGGGGGFRLGLDEETLRQVAEMTGGTYHVASSASELEKVFSELPTYMIVKHEVLEISVLFTAIAAFLVAMAILMSILWHPLP